MTTTEALGLLIPAAVSIFIALAAPYLTGLGRAQRTRRLEALQSYLAAAAPGSKQQAAFENLIDDHLAQIERVESKQVTHLRRIRRTITVMLVGVFGCGLLALISAFAGWEWGAVGEGRGLLVLMALGFLVAGAANFVLIGAGASREAVEAAGPAEDVPSEPHGPAAQASGTST